MRALLRAAAVAGVCALVALGSAAPALAAVTVSGTDIQPGSYGVLNFRVLNESDKPTTGLRLFLPEDTPFVFVNVQHKDGWTATTTTKPLAVPQPLPDGSIQKDHVTQVEWKVNSDSGAIKPDEFDVFSILAGPLPNQAQLVLPAEQVLSDGSTVAWDQEPTAGQPGLAYPAPVLTLLSPTVPSGDVDFTEDDTTVTASGTPLWPVIVALVIGFAALAGALVNYLMLRSATIEDDEEDDEEDEADEEHDDDQDDEADQDDD